MVTQKKETNNPKNPVTEFTDYQISVDMAKQICMRDWRLELNSQSGFQGCVSTLVISSVLTPPEVQNNGGVQIRELQDYIVSVDTAKHICLISRTEKGKQWSDH